MKVIRKRVWSLKPSPENAQLYRRPQNDPDIDALAASIKKRGLLERPIVTLDNYIVSGHRRVNALIRNGQVFVSCHVLPVRRDSMSKDEYVALLREHNRYRNRNVAEQVREEMVDIDPDEAFTNLVKSRYKSIQTPERNGVHAMTIEGSKKRYGISEDKAEHVKYIKQIVEERRDYWPLSVRGVHYPLLNYDFIRGVYWPRTNEPGHGTKIELPYKNDDGSYDATSNLITRLRLNGTIPWEVFDDLTRPFTAFPAFSDVTTFVRQERENLFAGYWRDLLQSQPNYIECFVEKNTINNMVLRVTENYQIPTSSGRGFNSIDPWHDLYERYQDSGKERLIVIVLSDYDPEGEMIPQVGGRTLRDDFGVDEDNLQIIKASVTRQQIEKYNLPKQNFAKETSSNHAWFVKRNNGDDSVYECEALPPPDMMNDLDHVIRSIIDIDLFNREKKNEEVDAVYLESVRRSVAEALKGLGE